MKILILGSGAREHAIGDKIKEESIEHIIFFLPGNGGTSDIGTNVTGISLLDKEGIYKFVKDENIEFVIVGPEQPLIDGITDYLNSKDVITFGPSAKAAAIEGDKAFSKRLMITAGVPTADYRNFTRAEKADAINYLSRSIFPVVIKATGPAAGKGVLISNSFSEATEAIEDIFTRDIFGNSGNEIIIEEFMTGEEASIFAVCDGKKFVLLPAAQDHKRIGDGDTGKNTGGMGAFAPAKIVTPALMEEIRDKIFYPVLNTMVEEGIPFRGCLYAGLMLTQSGPKVVEFNCRFGDPETQSVLQTFSGKFLKLLYESARGSIAGDYIQPNGVTSATVVTASAGYPDTFEKGFEISGLPASKDSIKIFHAGTVKQKDKIYTAGGRVLSLTSLDRKGSLKNAIDLCYKQIQSVKYQGIYYRKDIAHKGLRHEGE